MNNLNYASFGRRFVAFLIDTIIVALSFCILSLIALSFNGGISGLKDYKLEENPFLGLWIGIFAIYAIFFALLIFLLIGLLYEVIMLGSQKQATFGKLIMKIKITKENGEPINYLESFLRTVTKYLSGCIFIFLWLICLFTSKKQNLHDIIVKAIVINSK